MKALLQLSALFLSYIPIAICATGQGLDFIVVSCSMAEGRFHFEHLWALPENKPPDSRDGRLRISSKVQREGSFEPDDLRFECHLRHTRFTLIAKQPLQSDRGPFGAAPPITFSLLRDGRPLLENMIVGDFEHESKSFLCVNAVDIPKRTRESPISFCSKSSSAIAE